MRFADRATSARRLLRLADFLWKLPRGRFFYGTWVGSTWKGDPFLSCGTTACALGWGTTMPFFRRLGLKLIRRKYAINEAKAMKIFGLDESDFDYLFVPDMFVLKFDAESPGAGSGPRTVAKHIRMFVKKHRGEHEHKAA